MAAIQPERRREQRQHAEAREQGTTCIACHYNLVHNEVERRTSS
jgi:nitrate/TMAO reductase-like tetraheme cytochrome c subunit